MTTSEIAIVELAWDPPERSHGDLRGYQVTCRLIGPNSLMHSPQKIIWRNVTQTAFTSTLSDGIKFGRSYQFEVAAYNGVDLGLPVQLNITTPADLPETVPLKVRLTGLSATAIEVTWSPPPTGQHTGGDVLSYQVMYFEPNAPNSTEVIVDTSEPRVKVDNLRERTFYTVMVRTVTVAGPGPWSLANTIRTTAELPEPPSQITGLRINERQIKVTWNTAASTGTAGKRIPITGFRLLYAKNDGLRDINAWQILDVGPVMMATLDGLDPNADYEIKIKSRGADRRYGRLSESIIVGAQVAGGMAGLPGYPYPDSLADKQMKVGQLFCHWFQAPDTAKPDEATLRISWVPPPQTEGLWQFEIQLLGSRFYLDASNQPHREHFEPIVLKRAVESLIPPSLPPLVARYPPISGPPLHHQDQAYQLIVDELKANAVYDVHILPIYHHFPGRQGLVDGSVPPVERTSCHTLMLPPLQVPSPQPVAVKQRTGQVVMRVFRVTESLGRIHRYYLIVGKTPSVTTDEATTLLVQNVIWQNNLRDSSQLWDPDVFLAAEYRQDAFLEAQLEMLIGSTKSAVRHRRDIQPVSGRTDALTGTANPSTEVIVYGHKLHQQQEYKAFVVACTYANHETPGGQPSTDAQPMYSSQSTEETGEYANDKLWDPKLCTTSPWSTGFNPHRLVTHNGDDAEDLDKGLGGDVITGSADTLKKTRSQPELFIIIVVSVSATFVLLVVIGIVFGLTRLRKRAKGSRSDMKMTMRNSNSTQKEPLMSQKLLPTILESNGKTDVDPVLDTVDNATVPTKPIQGQTVKQRSAIAITQLVEHVTALKANNSVELSEEYESIDTHTALTWQHANLEANRPKNRYANVVAYDHSRVCLQSIPDATGSDYINANFIDGYQRQKAYIATQGPLPETFYDFWRMVWEQNSHVIVMMTKLEERARVKCDQYWPLRGTQTFTCPYDVDRSRIPAYQLSMKECSEFAYYTVRVFQLERLDQSGVPGSGCASQKETSVREVKHFQFTAWPDYGTPDHPQPLILFIRRVNQLRTHLLHQLQQERFANGDSNTGSLAGGLARTSDSQRPMSTAIRDDLGPIIVHCSAGVGRTGAYIAIDSQLERFRQEKSVDLYSAVGRMRYQRNFMIQTEEQYAFLYDVFVEATMVNGTEVTAHGLYNYVFKLRQTGLTKLPTSVSSRSQDGMANLSQGQTGLDEEFKLLSTSLLCKIHYASALQQENQIKNRFPDILPFEVNRVCLPPIRGINGSDYINASFIDGYRRRRAYIVAQTPLPNTVDDFWRLLWERNSPILVTLNEPSISHAGQFSSVGEIFWPIERPTRYQHLLVEPMVEYNMPHFILREFRLTDTRDGQSRTLRQFQLHGWPSDLLVPKTAEAIIDLIGQVHKTQTQFGQDGPITVHCGSGSGRSGVFVGISLLLERMRNEGMVDVFLTTRMLRTQRIGMIQTADQYAFCYSATLEFLASFDHYTS